MTTNTRHTSEDCAPFTHPMEQWALSSQIRNADKIISAFEKMESH